MDTARLANVIFDRGSKISQSRYTAIQESIESDLFTLDEYVVAYKLKESYLGKIAFKLNDGTSVLISESLIEKINGLNINKSEVSAYMLESYTNFKNIIGLVQHGGH